MWVRLNPASPVRNRNRPASDYRAPAAYGNPFMLTTLAPGLVFTAANMLQIRPYDHSVTANIRVDGAPGAANLRSTALPNTSTSRGTQKGAVVT